MEAKFTKRDLTDAWNAGVRRLSYENSKRRENEIWIAETPLEKEEWIDLKDKDVGQSTETRQHEPIVKCIKQFAKAFEEICLRSYQDADDDMIEFLDSNTITPRMTVGDFRKLYEAYKECT